MIKSIEIKNFKSIKEKFFPLKNLNLLLGLNGMGKSSFIQTLLAIKQSSQLSNGRLDLNSSRFINLGSTKDVLYQYSKQQDLAFDLKFINGKEINLQFKYVPEADYFTVKKVTRLLYPILNIMSHFMAKHSLVKIFNI